MRKKSNVAKITRRQCSGFFVGELEIGRGERKLETNSQWLSYRREGNNNNRGDNNSIDKSIYAINRDYINIYTE
jgi:hypothetical protein